MSTKTCGCDSVPKQRYISTIQLFSHDVIMGHQPKPQQCTSPLRLPRTAPKKRRMRPSLFPEYLKRSSKRIQPSPPLENVKRSSKRLRHNAYISKIRDLERQLAVATGISLPPFVDYPIED